MSPISIFMMKVSDRILILKEVQSEYFEMFKYNNHAVSKMLYHNDMVSFYDSVSFIILILYALLVRSWLFIRLPAYYSCLDMFEIIFVNQKFESLRYDLLCNVLSLISCRKTLRRLIHKTD